MSSCCIPVTKIGDLFIFIIFYRNTIQFTPTQIEAIRAGMQPGLTMVGTCPIFLIQHLRRKKHKYILKLQYMLCCCAMLAARTLCVIHCAASWSKYSQWAQSAAAAVWKHLYTHVFLCSSLHTSYSFRGRGSFTVISGHTKLMPPPPPLSFHVGN